jgi:UDP-N-acetylglucosamine 1-carboxyvinyltransferase
MLMGPLVTRFGRGFLPQPGGDKIGRRRLDTHFIGLQKLGAEFTYDQDAKTYHITGFSRLKGCYMLLDEASVTGTANIIMAATLAEGETTIFNAACEPYIVQLMQDAHHGWARASMVLAPTSSALLAWKPLSGHHPPTARRHD